MIGALEHGFYRVRLLIQDVLLWPGDQTSIKSFQFTAAIHGRGLTEKSSRKFSFSRGKNITIHDHDSCSDIDTNKAPTGWPQQQQSEHKKIFWLNFTSYFYKNYWHAEAHKWIWWRIFLYKCESSNGSSFIARLFSLNNCPRTLSTQIINFICLDIGCFHRILGGIFSHCTFSIN